MKVFVGKRNPTLPLAQSVCETNAITNATPFDATTRRFTEIGRTLELKIEAVIILGKANYVVTFKFSSSMKPFQYDRCAENSFSI